MATIVEDPKFLTASFINFLFTTNSEFIDTLSAPLINNFSIFFRFLIPPPTVNGIKISLAVFLTNLVKLLVP